MATNQKHLDARKLLRHYLSKYYRAKKRKIALQARLRDLRLELEVGPGAKPLSFDNIHGKGQTSCGAASMALRIVEIEERINRQIAVEADTVTEVMNMIDLLGSGSIEREILEYRHIDCLSWMEIQNRVHMTETPCFKHYNAALDQLLASRRVRELIGLEKR